LIDGILLQHYVDPAAFEPRHDALRTAVADGVRRMIRR